MRIHCILFFGILIVSLCNCVNTHASFDQYNQMIILNKSYLLESKSCDISKQDSTGNNFIYLLVFDKVNGGSTYLLPGRKKIKEVNGYDYKRLHIIDGKIQIASFSINDFKATGEDTVNVNLLLEN